jgi:hypothetical protein
MRVRFIMMNVIAFNLIFATNFAKAETVSNEQKCEIHIWPAYHFNALTQGAGSLFAGLSAIDDAAAHQDKNYSDQTLLREALDINFQEEAIKRSGLSDFLDFKESKITLHDNNFPNNSVPMSDSKIRSSESKIDCYYEIFINYSNYNSNFISGSTLQNYFRVKKFSNAQSKFIFSAGGAPIAKIGAIGVGLPADKEGPTEKQRIQSGYTTNISKFVEKNRAKLASMKM